ncbi:NAD(P)H-dependent oxidoreductase [Novosphingobium album (ex Liu et al. 2023)]|uniref:NAD(P)H-dependent oxidoreductase n=1 Tax=Novosphingobium album (ex Liu et al. 2023) TaxID=3031130 RepID=A0ABT5WS60_9SPHN|nr:NAD(P)H-dependent oxidoreductase [Novosphingobium album (ex Liu et al. 2023)]MDE8652883.1 NAD(P)H-dependent oxidoreductase [Novosphingobium album (ex Liu et al. 2023)]
MTRILVINGHPDSGRHFLHVAADAYAAGAATSGHEVRRLDVAALEFPLIRSEQQYHDNALPEDIAKAQQDILWAEHLLILFPLWLGDAPAYFKAFLEQVARPEFAFVPKEHGFPQGRLAGRSARLVVSMGTPTPIYSYYYGGHGVKSFKRNILEFVGIHPVRYAIIGSVGGPARHREKWLARLRHWGEQAA